MRERPSAAELVALGEQIAEQAVHLDAAMHRLLADLRCFDEAGGWHVQGFTSCAHWLSHRVGWDLATSREHLRVARALATLPEVDAALASGKLSYSKARAITRVATPTSEPTLLQYAEVSTASQLETICRKFHAAERLADHPRQPLPRDDDRHVTASPTASGLVCVKAFLLPDEAALLMQAIQHAARACQEESATDTGPADVCAPSQLSVGASAEACVESHRAPAEAPPARPLAAPAPGSRKLNRADGLMALINAQVRGDSPQRSPIEMIITTRGLAADAAADTTGPTTTTTASSFDPHDRGASIPVAIVAETNTYFSSETARRLACDCGLVEATVDAQGQPLSIGRKTRTIPAAIKRALLLRDRTCRFPGCDHRLFLDGHHLLHWADGGETSLRNLILLCTACHARVHEHRYRVESSSTGDLTFCDSRGNPVIAVSPRPTPPDLGWPAIRAANAASCPQPLSAETSIDLGRHGFLDHKEAVGRLLRLHAHAPNDDADTARDPSGSTAAAATRRPLDLPVTHAPDESRRNEDFADPDYDVVAAGHRADDLLEWSMDELRATGLDPMATVPAPIWPPPSWYDSKQRPVPAPARQPPAPRRGRASQKRSRAMPSPQA